MFNEELQKEITLLRKDLNDLIEEFYRNNFSAQQDFNKYSNFNSRLKIPTLATISTTCEVGEVCFATDTSKLYVCTAANTWTAQT